MVLSLFKWAEGTALASAIRDSVWLFPTIEAVHLVALAVLGGTVLVVNLRLLNLGVREGSVAYLVHTVRPWFLGSLLVMLASGLPLVMSEPLKYYYNPPFWWKMAFLASSLLFTWMVIPKVLEEGPLSRSVTRRVVAVISLALWSGVGIMGRGIGFY